MVPPPFPKWNCTYHEINIKTGQSRTRKYRFFIRTKYEVGETVLSKALSEPVDANDIEEWHTVYSHAPSSSRVSPNTRFHGAWNQLHSLKLAFKLLDESLPDSPEIRNKRKAEISQRVLTLWQTEGEDYSANDYIDSLLDEEILLQSEMYV